MRPQAANAKKLARIVADQPKLVLVQLSGDLSPSKSLTNEAESNEEQDQQSAASEISAPELQLLTFLADYFPERPTFESEEILAAEDEQEEEEEEVEAEEEEEQTESETAESESEAQPSSAAATGRHLLSCLNLILLLPLPSFNPTGSRSVNTSKAITPPSVQPARAYSAVPFASFTPRFVGSFGSPLPASCPAALASSPHRAHSLLIELDGTTHADWRKQQDEQLAKAVQLTDSRFLPVLPPAPRSLLRVTCDGEWTVRGNEEDGVESRHFGDTSSHVGTFSDDFASER